MAYRRKRRRSYRRMNRISYRRVRRLRRGGISL